MRKDKKGESGCEERERGKEKSEVERECVRRERERRDKKRG